jgi:outer membrane protein assembly factor BamE (lipoprotein component of BamABCDE complex)
MNYFLRIIVVLIISITMMSCASNGTKIEKSNVEKIVAGKTTKTEMITVFGNPLSQSFNSDGKLSMIWFYVYVGPFGTGMEQQNLAVLFDENEVVEKYNLVDGGSNMVRFGR